jgi:hypothetical protein
MFRPGSAFVLRKIRSSSSHWTGLAPGMARRESCPGKTNRDRTIGELAMSDSISPLDDGYMRLGHVAMLMAEENEKRAYEDIMDRFKQAVFAGELEPPHVLTPDRDNPGNWLHMEIVIPRCELTPAQAELEPRPKRFYGVGRASIVSVLFTSGGVPGDAARWSPLLDIGTRGYSSDQAPSALAAIPFREFPERGRLEIEALVVPKAKLATWFEGQGESLPAFLVELPRENGCPAVAAMRGEDQAPRPPGRPHKPAWPRIVQLVRELRDANLDWQKKRLAYEAWQLARGEFSEAELPSVATIQRSMVDILGGGSG